MYLVYLVCCLFGHISNVVIYFMACVFSDLGWRGVISWSVVVAAYSDLPLWRSCLGESQLGSHGLSGIPLLRCVVCCLFFKKTNLSSACIFKNKIDPDDVCELSWESFIMNGLVTTEMKISLIGGAIRPRLPGKLFWDVHGRDLRALNHEAGLNIILYSDWL